MTAKTTKPRTRKSPGKATNDRTATGRGKEGRTAIIEAALKAFARDTFDGASVPSIAKEAGVGGPLVHYHFGSKENLWRETVDFAFEALETPFEAIAMSSRDLAPVDALKMLCRALANFAQKFPEHVLVLTNEGRSANERFEYVSQKHLKVIHRTMDQVIERAVAEGQIKPVPTVHLTNTLILSIIYFYASKNLIESLYKDSVNDKTFGTDHIDWLLEIVFAGVQIDNSKK